MSLSDKIMPYSDISNCPAIYIDDVKEFIRELKDKFPKTDGIKAFSGEQFQFAIDELAGDKLI